MNSTLNRTILCSAISIALLLCVYSVEENIPIQHECHTVYSIQNAQEILDEKNALLVERISNRYTHVPVELLASIVKYSDKYAKPDFPTQPDLLAMIAVESSFNPHSKSHLKSDAAVGLTQIRPGMWKHKMSKTDLASIENQIKYGSDILSHNYQRVNDKSLALHAYNLGLTATLRGKRSKTYVVKYERELDYLVS